MSFGALRQTVDVLRGRGRTVELLDGDRGAGVTRRDVLKLITAVLGAIGVDSAAVSDALASNKGQEAPLSESDVESLVHETMGLVALDAFGTACFFDAIAGMARGKNTLMQSFANLTPLKDFIPKGHEGETGHGHSDFPIANMVTGMVLNIARCTFFGEEVRHHTIDEFETTLKGVGLLMILTSAAKGITAVEGEVIESSEASDEDKPNKVLGDSIFQLTAVAAATQIPLTAFGNAAIGNGEFSEVKKAFESLYTTIEGATKDDVIENVKKHENKKLLGFVKKAFDQCKEKDGESEVDFIHRVLLEAANLHTQDLMIVLMSTSCDDAHAAMGDAGPIVGIYQSFGNDMLSVIPTILPYTIMIALERAMMAADRAGLSKTQVLTKERWDFLRKFVVNTWINLGAYLINVVPDLMSKISGNGNEKMPKTDTVGRDFSVLDQMARDIENIFGVIWESIAPGKAYDKAKIRNALLSMNAANDKLKREVGTKVLKDDEPDPKELTSKIVGPVADELPGENNEKLKELVAKLSAEPDEGLNAQLQGLQALLKDHRKAIGAAYQALQNDKEWFNENGEKPSMLVVAKLLTKQAEIRKLLDFEHWEHAIGPELAETMFVVFLQGLHLPFIINTVQRFIYDQDYFKNMPLKAQEIASVLLNDVLSMFADNWADAVAHSKWLTVMYFNALEKKYGKKMEELGVNDATYQDDVTKLVPERFAARKAQMVALLKGKNVEEGQISKLITDVVNDADDFYDRALVMSMLTAVTGGGKALTGNAPHFTFAAGQDLELGDTLADMKNHPVYHVWELIFSTGYSIVIGPFIRKVGRKLFGQNTEDQVKALLASRFEEAFPGVNERIASAIAKDRKPAGVRETTRRSVLTRMFS